MSGADKTSRCQAYVLGAATGAVYLLLVSANSRSPMLSMHLLPRSLRELEDDDTAGAQNLSHVTDDMSPDTSADTPPSPPRPRKLENKLMTSANVLMLWLRPVTQQLFRAVAPQDATFEQR